MTHGRTRFTPRLVMGLAVLGLGVVLMLANLDLWSSDTAIHLWMAGVLVALGLLSWQRHRSGAVAFLLMFVGVWLALAELFDTISLRTELMFPLILVFLGARLIWKSMGGGDGDSEMLLADSTFHTIAVWSGVGRKVSSSNFVSGEAVAVMGGCTVDLRSSFIAEGVAEIFVFAMWGGVEILVPEDWSVTCEGIPVMGGFDDATDPPRGGSQQRLVVHGVALMGAAEIRNHEEESD